MNDKAKMLSHREKLSFCACVGYFAGECEPELRSDSTLFDQSLSLLP